MGTDGLLGGLESDGLTAAGHRFDLRCRGGEHRSGVLGGDSLLTAIVLHSSADELSDSVKTLGSAVRIPLRTTLDLIAANGVPVS